MANFPQLQAPQNDSLSGPQTKLRSASKSTPVSDKAASSCCNSCKNMCVPCALQAPRGDVHSAAKGSTKASAGNVHEPSPMAHQTAAESLASYAASLRHGDVPCEVVRRARDCVIDTVAACVFGHQAPAGRIIARHVAGRSNGACHVLVSGGAPVQAEDAALANGTLAHALELDSLSKPGAGVHPGAVLLSA